MSTRSSGPGRNPVFVSLCLFAVCLTVALICAAAAHAGQFKAVLCAGNVGLNNYGTQCGPGSPDPAGNAAFLRIAENQAGGNAGPGAYGFVHWDTPPFVHFKTAGGWTRQPNAFNDGWRARFWGINFANQGFEIFTQGQGLGTTGTFAPHASGELSPPPAWVAVFPLSG